MSQRKPHLLSTSHNMDYACLWGTCCAASLVKSEDAKHEVAHGRSYSFNLTSISSPHSGLGYMW